MMKKTQKKYHAFPGDEYPTCVGGFRCIGSWKTKEEMILGIIGDAQDEDCGFSPDDHYGLVETEDDRSLRLFATLTGEDLKSALLAKGKVDPKEVMKALKPFEPGAEVE